MRAWMRGGVVLLLAVALGAPVRAADEAASAAGEPAPKASPKQAAAAKKAAATAKAPDKAPVNANVPAPAEAPAPAKAEVPPVAAVPASAAPAKTDGPAVPSAPASVADSAKAEATPVAAEKPAAPLATAPGAPSPGKGGRAARKAAKNKQQAPGTVAPAPTLAPETDDLAYNPTGRRDPFRPPRVNQLLASGGERTPLQRYELGQLRLVAVIYDTGDARAVVEDEGGLGYIIKVGTKIGINDGIVRGIERGKVLVEEESVDFFGERRSSEVVLEMASGERGNR